jgi:hypothetical protein
MYATKHPEKLSPNPTRRPSIFGTRQLSFSSLPSKPMQEKERTIPPTTSKRRASRRSFSMDDASDRYCSIIFDDPASNIDDSTQSNELNDTSNVRTPVDLAPVTLPTPDSSASKAERYPESKRKNKGAVIVSFPKTPRTRSKSPVLPTSQRQDGKTALAELQARCCDTEAVNDTQYQLVVAALEIP